VKNRYRSWDSGIGKEIESGKANFDTLDQYICEKGEVDKNESGRQEFLENVFNRYL
jgi:xylose isomerase